MHAPSRSHAGVPTTSASSGTLLVTSIERTLLPHTNCSLVAFCQTSYKYPCGRPAQSTAGDSCFGGGVLYAAIFLGSNSSHRPCAPGLHRLFQLLHLAFQLAIE